MKNEPLGDQEFVRTLNAEDPMGVVVRGHIHIEALLNQIIERRTSNPGQLPRINFSQSVKLAAALGMGEEAIGPLLKLGQIRNMFGHRLDVTLTMDMSDDLFRSMCQRDQESTRRHVNEFAEITGGRMPDFDDLDSKPKFMFSLICLAERLRMEGHRAEEVGRVSSN